MKINFQKLWILSLLLLGGVLAQAQPSTAAIEGLCTPGAAQATTQGMKSSNYQLGVIPYCKVEVFLTGTTNHPPAIYSDGNNTPLSNPFTALPTGQWSFFAPVSQGYDITLSGGVPPNTFPVPRTISQAYPAQQVINGSSGNISPGTGLQVGIYSPTTTKQINPSNIMTDSTGNNLTVPAQTSTASLVVNGSTPQTGVSGNGGKLQGTTSAPKTAVDCAQFDNNGNVVDAGGPCGVGQVALGSNYSLGVYAGTSQALINPAHITTDSAGNNLTVPGQVAIGGVPAGTLPLCPNGPGGVLTTTGCGVSSTGVTWPPSCTTGVYSPASNTCVASGTAANPAGTTGQSQVNFGGVFGAIPGSVSDPTYGWQTQGGSCYAKGFQTGGGNNGIVNAMANCAAIISDPSYGSTESIANYATFALRTPVFFSDSRPGNYNSILWRNPTTDSTGKPLSPIRLNNYNNGMTALMALCSYDMSPLGSNGDTRDRCVDLLEYDLNPGRNNGAWQVTVPLTVEHNSAAAGTQEGIFVAQHTGAVGDNAGMYIHNYSNGGEVMGSAEGTKGLGILDGEETNTFAGSITNATNTPANSTVVTTTPNAGMVGASINYGLGTGRYLIPIGTCVSYPSNCPAAPFTGQAFAISAGLDNVGSTVTATPATGTITASTVYGTLAADVNTPMTGANVQPPTFATSMTFSVNIEGGVNGGSSQFNTTELACFDSSYHECARPTAVGTPSGGVQSVTMPLRRQHSKVQTGGTSHLYQGGMSGYCLIPLAYVNTINAGQPIRYCYDVFGSRIVTGTLTSVPTSAGGAVVYTGTNLTGMCVGGGQTTISGFVNSQNNGSFVCSSSTATTLTVYNPSSTSESGASATATTSLLQAGTFGYSSVVAMSNVTSQYFFSLTSTQLTSSGTTVSGNQNLPLASGFKANAGMSIYILNSTGLDGQCNNLQFVGTSASSFTCTNPNLSGAHTNTSTQARAYLVNTTCSGCNATTAGQIVTSYALRPMAEVLDVRNAPTATQFSIASNVLTVQAAPNTLAVGMQVFLSGFTTGTYLNNQYMTILSRSATQFTAAFTHADVASTPDIGSIVPQAPAIDGTLTLEPNILGTLANGSYVEEVHHPIAQYAAHTEVVAAYDPFSVGHSVFTATAVGAGISNGNGYTSSGVYLFPMGNANPDSMYQAAGGAMAPPSIFRMTGAYWAGVYWSHFADGGATLAIQNAPNYQLNNPNFVAQVIDLENLNGDTVLTDTPNTGDIQLATNGNAVWTAASHSFNGPVNSLTNDAGLISGMAVNYATFSNQLSSWSGAGGGGAPITCATTDDYGYPACTLVGPTSGGWNLFDSLIGYTPLTQGAAYTFQARMKGAVGGETIQMSMNSQVPTTVTLTTSWANYCVSYVVSQSGVSNGAQFTQSIPTQNPSQTIYVSSVVVRPGVACGPPILTTNNQILTPTAVNKFPGTSALNTVPASANVGFATLGAGTATVTTTTACTAASSCVYSLTNCGVGGTQGMLAVGTVTAGTSFVINSSAGAADTSKVCWRIN